MNDERLQEIIGGLMYKIHIAYAEYNDITGKWGLSNRNEPITDEYKVPYVFDIVDDARAWALENGFDVSYPDNSKSKQMNLL